MTRRLVLVRHGQTDWNSVGRAQGHADISLDDDGPRPGSRGGAVPLRDGPVRLWSSDLARAHETAAYVAEAAGLEVETDPRLREYDVGVRSGLTREEFGERHPREYAAWLVHDESLLVDGRGVVDAGARPCPSGAARVHGVPRPGRDRHCRHPRRLPQGGLLGLLGWPRETSRGLRGMDNCAWTVVGEHDVQEGLRMVSYNETAAVGQHPERASGGDFASDEADG